MIMLNKQEARMNKLEKLNAERLLDRESDAPLTDTFYDVIAKLNEAITHITALESEVDRLKGHRHDLYNVDGSISVTSYPDPPIMETDKQ
jgi:hypothetical protein